MSHLVRSVAAASGCHGDSSVHENRPGENDSPGLKLVMRVPAPVYRAAAGAKKSLGNAPRLAPAY